MKGSITYLCLLFFITGIATNAYSQRDTAFWFAAPDISSDFSYDRPIMIRLTAYNQPSTVTISQPGGGGMTTQTVSLAANTTQSVNLTPWLSNIECAPANTVLNYGIKISATTNISAYYEVNVGGPNPEIFALKGTNALGNQFYISSQYLLSNSTDYTPRPYSSFNIVATENNTTITINPTQNIVGHAAGIPFNITLNKGQTYAAVATSQAAAAHLQGSHIISDKPIAVTLSDDLLDGAAFGGVCRDMAGDQTIPVNITGTEYIAFKSNLNSPFDKLYITATQNGTTVTQDGILITTLNAGQSTQLTISTPVTYVQTNNPAYAYHLAGYGCEVGSAILPKINCTGSSSVSVTRSTNEPFTVTLLVRNGGQGGFLVNGSASVVTAGSFTVVPGTGGAWYYTKTTLPLGTYPNGSVITIANSIALFQEGVLQGDIAGVSFGYFSDYNTIKATAITTTPVICEGDDIQLASETVASASYDWQGPAGFNSSSQNVTINNASPANSGDYILTLTVPGCGISKDTVTVTVNPHKFTTINQSICEGQVYEGYNATGTYTNVFTSASGCDSTRTLNLTVKPKSFSNISATICEGDNYAGHTTSGVFTDTYTAANGCDSVRTLNLTVIPAKHTAVNAAICQGQSYFAGGANQTISGIYKDTLTAASGCDSIITTTLVVHPKPVPNLGPDKNICQGSTIILNPGTFSSYQWQDLSTSPTYTTNTTGTYWVTVTDANNCSNTDTLRITNLIPLPADFLKPSDSICNNDKLTVQSLNNYSGYLWSTGSTQSFIVVFTPGQYSLTVTDANNCIGKDSIIILPKKCIEGVYIPTAFTPNKDQLNDLFKATVQGPLINFRLEVYNRNGELVFSTNDPLKGWNGEFKGVPQNTQVFVWQCFYQFERSEPGFQKGIVTLIR